MRMQTRPLVIDAIAARSILNQTWDDPSIPYWVIMAKKNGRITFHDDVMVVKTLRGNKKVLPGNWVIHHENGDLLVLTYEQLQAQYEEVTG